MDGTVRATGRMCVACETAVALELHQERRVGRSTRVRQLMAVVAEGKRRRIYVAPTDEQVRRRRVTRPDDVPDGELVDALAVSWAHRCMG